MAKFIPSPYQQAVFDFIQKDTGSAVIEAVAGSGKTTTIVQALRLIPENKSVLFLAFNKSIANELKTRVPKHVRAATFHAQGFSAWMRRAGRNVQVDANKMKNIIRSIMPEEEQIMYRSFVSRLVGLAKNAGMGVLAQGTLNDWMGLVNHHDLELDHEEADYLIAIRHAQNALSSSIASANVVIDFDDMLYMPLIENATFYKNDFVFVDEAQDCSPLQLEILKKMLRPNGRLVAVGDSHQALYGFRGADSESMARIARNFQAQVLPLSVSYRCPKAVVKAAKDYCPHIEPFDGAVQGKVIDLNKVDKEFEHKPTDAVICRNTKPLISYAYSLIAQNIPVKIMGRDFGQGLISLIKKMKARGIDRLIKKLETYRAREIQKYLDKDDESRAQSVEDKVDSVITIIENLEENERTVPGLVRKIERLFTDDGSKDMLTLATVHKSKGLEWDRVFILGREDYMPSKWARKKWQKEQENNLIYVAYTRAKKELYLM